MGEKIKGLRLNITISAILSIVIGILLVAYPTQVTLAISKVIAGIIVLAGVAIVGSQLFENNKNVMGITVGAILALLGVWMFLSPTENIVMNIIPIAIGVILVLHGVQDLSMAIEVVKNKGSRAWLLFVGAIVNIVLGLVCIGMAFKFLTTVVWAIGVMLIFDGVTDILMVKKVRSSSKVVVDSTIVKEEDI